jgi:tetratricopeptide (TPR) repeat protein
MTGSGRVAGRGWLLLCMGLLALPGQGLAIGGEGISRSQESRPERPKGTGEVPASAPTEFEARQEATRLRAMYFERDYEGVVAEGRKVIGRFPGPGEARAWYLLSLASIFGNAPDAIAEAERWAAARPDEPWARFALAGTLGEEYDRFNEALPASREAFRRARSHPDFVWLLARSLVDARRYQEALDLIDRSIPRTGNPAELLVLKGDTLLRMSAGDPPNEAIRDGAFQQYAKAREADPGCVGAHYRPGRVLVYRKQFDEALPLLRRAADLAPFSTDVHQSLWDALMGPPDLPADKKAAEVESDIRALLRVRGGYPGTLLAVSRQYGELNRKERREEIEGRILKEFPDGLEAEWVLVERERRFASDHSWEEMKSPRVREAYLKMARDFIARPQHRFEGLLGESYTSIFDVLRDDPKWPESEMLPVIRGMLAYDRINLLTNRPAAACALADRKMHLEEAETILAEGFAEVRREGSRERAYRYDSRKEQKDQVRYLGALAEDASGWVHLQQGRREEAEAELLRARKGLERSQALSDRNLLHLGRLYEANGDLDRAEQCYADGMAVPVPRDNPCRPALQELYRRRTGGLAGFDAYLAKFSAADREARKKKILAERIAAPESIQAFELKALDGRRVSSEQLHGKIAVVNFWGVWCTWCVQEMPEIQKLYEKYRADPEVAILTIDNDPSPETVREWIKKKGYTFQVLLDDGYVGGRARIVAFPTTWFVDREGRKTFVRDSWSRDLVEEYGWRIEALRGRSPL